MITQEQRQELERYYSMGMKIAPRSESPKAEEARNSLALIVEASKKLGLSITFIKNWIGTQRSRLGQTRKRPLRNVTSVPRKVVRLSSYSVFLKNFKSAYIKEHPNAELGTLNKEAGKAWSLLSKEEKSTIGAQEITRPVQKNYELKKGRDRLCETMRFLEGIGMHSVWFGLCDGIPYRFATSKAQDVIMDEAILNVIIGSLEKVAGQISLRKRGLMSTPVGDCNSLSLLLTTLGTFD